MHSDPLAKRVFNKMYDNDPFSQWLGIECTEIIPGKCILRMKVRKEMLNGFNVAHGGITYSLADSALAFASNSHGVKSLSIETSISHTEPVNENDILTAVAVELKRSNKIGIYDIRVANQIEKTVALFRGIVYRTGKNWFE